MGTSESAPEIGHVVLIGLMGSGKTTVGTRLAARLGRPFVDNDDALCTSTGKSARVLADELGADRLHELETAALCDALASETPAVVAAAAAAVLTPQATECIGGHIVVWLTAGADVVVRRIAEDDDHRPFLDDDAADVLREQIAAREPVYRRLATLTVDMTTADPDDAAEAIAVFVRERG